MERLFSEIYNRYFGIVNLLMTKKGNISRKMLQDTVQKHGFGESLLFLLPKLSANEWELFEEQDGAYRSKIRGGVKQPLSRLQKRWLKAVLADPRAGLFLEEDHRQALDEMLNDVTPLFHYEDFYRFDRFSDGDDYADAGYRAHFRKILQAIHNEQQVRIRYEARTGRTTQLLVKPLQLEYSAKNDCFRLLGCSETKTRLRRHTLRLSRMRNVTIANEETQTERKEPPVKAEMPPQKVTLLIRDSRNAMERTMLQFADYRKNTCRIGDDLYRCEIFYDKDDETELLIEILSFGPVLEVVDEPENERFLGLIRERLQKQRLLKN